MKKVLVLLLIVSCTGFACVYPEKLQELLSQEDWLLLEETNKSPTITIPGTDEAYYSEWECYDSQIVQLINVKVIYGGKDWRSPTAYVRKKDKLIDYSLDPISKEKSEEVIKQWQDLTRESGTTCFMSTFLQNTPDSELRIIQKIKTQNDEWDDSEIYLDEAY